MLAKYSYLAEHFITANITHYLFQGPVITGVRRYMVTYLCQTSSFFSHPGMSSGSCIGMGMGVVFASSPCRTPTPPPRSLLSSRDCLIAKAPVATPCFPLFYKSHTINKAFLSHLRMTFVLEMPYTGSLVRSGLYFTYNLHTIPHTFTWKESLQVG